MSLRSKSHGASKKPVMPPEMVAGVPTRVFMSACSSVAMSRLKLPQYIHTLPSSTSTVGSMLWASLPRIVCDTMGPPAWSVHGPKAVSETATPMPNLSGAVLAASCTGTYQ